MRQIKLSKRKWLYVGSVAALAIVALGVGFLFSTSNNSLELAKASGVTPTITPSAQNVSTSGSIAIAYTASAAMPIGTTLTLTYSTSYTGTITTANTTVNGVAPSSITAPTAYGTGNNRVTITTANAITSGSTVTLTMTGLTTPVAAGNYSFLITSSVNDYGGNFQYVGEANVVDVRAFVPLRLAFNIRNTADTANTNVCDMGEASTTSIVTCSYRLKVSTNAAGGYTVSMQASGNLTNGVNSITNAAAGPTGSAITAGTEMYGVTVAPGSLSSTGSISALSAYTASGSNVVNYASTSNANIIQATGPNSPQTTDTTRTSLITHRLAISDDTPVGSYTQRITYRVTPTF